jgi:phosphate starvation-inducible PhoH-like protein
LENRIPLLSIDEEQQLFGLHDRNARKLGRELGVRISSREGALKIQGPTKQVRAVSRRVESILEKIRSGEKLPPSQVEECLLGNPSPEGESPRRGEGASRARSSAPKPRTPAQKEYMDVMANHDLVFATGPAGTGKTFLAVAAAVRALQSGQVKRLVLTRPAVEAGERLGFLPGSMAEKIDPYLRPLYDALNDLMGPAAAGRMRDMDVVEVAPLAFMRGRTLNHAFVILDEAQNATSSQMKMLLTRVGEGGRAVVTGDLTQPDLPQGGTGLEDAIRRLRNLEGIAHIEFGKDDVQRSALVQRIVNAYADPT